MGKHNHIPELLGMENYVGWAMKMQYALVCEDHWCHINTKAEPGDLLRQPSVIPVPTNPTNPTTAETAEIHEWLLEDMKAKELITHQLSSFIASLIPRSCTVTVHKVWQILQEHFNQMDMSAQYLLCQQCKSYT
jgi:hypothetical protein